MGRRPTVRTRRREKLILEVIRKNGSVTEACIAVGMSRPTFYAWMEDPPFAKAVALAREELEDSVHAKIFDLAKAGSERLLIWKAEQFEREREKREQAVSRNAVMQLVDELAEGIRRHVQDEDTVARLLASWGEVIAARGGAVAPVIQGKTENGPRLARLK